MKLNFFPMVLVVGLSACASGSKPVAAVTQTPGNETLLKSLLRKPGSTPNVINPFDAICQGQYVDRITPAQKAVYANSMALRDHRIWHYFWHSTRNAWHKMTDDEKEFFLHIDARWDPPRLLGKPANVPPGVNPSTFDPKKNSAGEDFLFMHNQMLTELQTSFRAENLPCISAWAEVPGPTDTQWPVPGRKVGVKSPEAFVEMKKFDDSFRDPTWLRGKTLGYVGYTMEIALHNNLHMRFTEDSSPLGDRPEITSVTMEGLKKFDSPKYDLLSDSYSAHVNPIFWKLHGRVENVIFDWLSANGYSEISEDCGSRSGCYQWKGTWVGAAPASHLHMQMGDAKNQTSRSMGGAPEQSFEQKFQAAVDDYVNGGATGSNRDSVERGMGGSRYEPKGGADTQSAERTRRLKVVASAMKKLDQNSPMNRGVLTQQRLSKLQHTRSLGNPIDDYVNMVDSEP